MANKYYPEFYMRKRQKEAVFKRITWGAAFVALLALAVFSGYLFYMSVLEPRRTKPGATPELADQRTQAMTRQRLAGLQNQPLPDDGTGMVAPEETAPNLEDLPYAQSFADVGVTLETGGQPAAAAPPDDAAPPVDDSAPVDPNAAAAEQLPATPYDTITKSPDTAATPPETVKPKPAEKPEPKKPVEKPKEKPKTDAETKPKPKPEEKPKAADEQPATGGFIYKVYAGSFASEEAAQQRRDELKALGFPGSVIKVTGEYNLFVMELQDLNKAAAMVGKLKDNGFGAAYTARVKKK